MQIKASQSNPLDYYEEMLRRVNGGPGGREEDQPEQEVVPGSDAASTASGVQIKQPKDGSNYLDYLGKAKEFVSQTGLNPLAFVPETDQDAAERKKRLEQNAKINAWGQMLMNAVDLIGVGRKAIVTPNQNQATGQMLSEAQRITESEKARKEKYRLASLENQMNEANMTRNIALKLSELDRDQRDREFRNKMMQENLKLERGRFYLSKKLTEKQMKEADMWKEKLGYEDELLRRRMGIEQSNMLKRMEKEHEYNLLEAFTKLKAGGSGKGDSEGYLSLFDNDMNYVTTVTESEANKLLSLLSGNETAKSEIDALKFSLTGEGSKELKKYLLSKYWPLVQDAVGKISTRGYGSSGAYTAGEQTVMKVLNNVMKTSEQWDKKVDIIKQAILANGLSGQQVTDEKQAEAMAIYLIQNYQATLNK